MKFGGSSLTGTAGVVYVASLIGKYGSQDQTVVVVSALQSITNQLLETAKPAAQKDKLFTSISNHHLTIARQLQLDPIVVENVHTLLETLRASLETRDNDLIASFGERLSAQLVAGACNKLGIGSDAVSSLDMIRTTAGSDGNNHILYPESQSRAIARLEPLLYAGLIPIVTGYIAQTVDGKVTTLGRGGSDLTATLLARFLKADEVILWKDELGISEADPKVNPEARLLPRITYHEAENLARQGAGVLHPEAMAPIAVLGIPVWIKSVYLPHLEGTRISHERQ